MKKNRTETIRENSDLFKIVIKYVKENDIIYQHVNLYCNGKCIATNERIVEIDNKKYNGEWI